MNAPTVAEILRDAVRRLAAAGVPSPEVDARLLLGRVLRLPPLELGLAPGRRLTPVERDSFADLLGKRAARLPLQFLLGDAEFYGRRFQVAPGVLIPRPETEAVVEAAIAVLDAAPRDQAFIQVADIGSGAGVIGLTLAAERPRVRVTCVDRDALAVSLTGANAAALGVASRVQVVRGDGVEPLARSAFELLVSNPPYLPTDVIASLEPEVREHDPRFALDGGPDGLALIARLIADAGSVVRPGGHLVLEIGHDQAAAAEHLAAKHGWSAIAVRPDLSGHDRVLLARRPQ